MSTKTAPGMASSVSIVFLTATYKDIVITYDEDYDCWRYTYGDIDRRSDSLVKAKENIDKLELQGAKAKFSRQDVFVTCKYGQIKPGVATSVQQMRWGAPQVRVTVDGKSGTYYPDQTYVASAENAAAVVKITELQKQYTELEHRISELRRGLTRITVPELPDDK